MFLRAETLLFYWRAITCEKYILFPQLNQYQLLNSLSTESIANFREKTPHIFIWNSSHSPPNLSAVPRSSGDACRDAYKYKIVTHNYERTRPILFLGLWARIVNDITYIIDPHTQSQILFHLCHPSIVWAIVLNPCVRWDDAAQRAWFLCIFWHIVFWTN